MVQVSKPKLTTTDDLEMKCLQGRCDQDVKTFTSAKTVYRNNISNSHTLVDYENQ